MIFSKEVMDKVKTGEILYIMRDRIYSHLIKNQIIKNKLLEDKDARKLRKKYYPLIENRKETPKDQLCSSDKVWIFWYQGIEQAPDLVKVCVESAKKVFKDKEVIILTKDNYKNYVEFPDYINEKFEKKIITFTHFSDLLRIELLARYGGIWCDATLFFTDEVPKFVTDSDLFVFKNVDLDRNDTPNIVASSWFISAKSNNDILVATRDLLFEYHKKEKFLKNYFLFHLFFKMATDKFSNQWKNMLTFNNINPHILQFELLDEFNEERLEQIKSFSFVHKLNKAIKNTDINKKTFYDYVIGNIDKK